MRIRLLTIDLDGTLLNSSKSISDESIRVLSSAREMSDLKIVLASARPPRSVMPFYTQLKLDTPMINHNGAVAWNPTTGKILLHRPVQARHTRDIALLARKMYPRCLISGEVFDEWFTDRVEMNWQSESQKTWSPTAIKPVDQWLNQPISRLLILGQTDWLDNIQKAVQARHSAFVTATKTEECLLQILHIAADKGDALQIVSKEMGISREHILAIGDNSNDAGMLSWAGVGVAMANGSPRALSVADHVTKHNDAGGVAAAVRQFVLDDPDNA